MTQSFFTNSFQKRRQLGSFQIYLSCLLKVCSCVLFLYELKTVPPVGIHDVTLIRSIVFIIIVENIDKKLFRRHLHVFLVSKGQRNQRWNSQSLAHIDILTCLSCLKEIIRSNKVLNLWSIEFEMSLTIFLSEIIDLSPFVIPNREVGVIQIFEKSWVILLVAEELKSTARFNDRLSVRKQHNFAVFKVPNSELLAANYKNAILGTP